jgi:methenyltetrahydrofolate cyclohydrolase
MYIEKPVRDYVDTVAAREPVPGGGSVAALAGALGAALTSMVCVFTSGNPKYASVESEVQRIQASAGELRERLLRLVDEDIEVYAKVTSAYKLPRGTDPEKAARRTAIQQALVAAAEVPMGIVRAAREVVLLGRDLVGIGNPNLVSDVGVGVLLAEAALRGAALNVEINAAGIKDQEIAGGLRSFLAAALPEVAGIKEEIMAKTMAIIGGVGA